MPTWLPWRGQILKLGAMWQRCPSDSIELHNTQQFFCKSESFLVFQCMTLLLISFPMEWTSGVTAMFCLLTPQEKPHPVAANSASRHGIDEGCQESHQQWDKTHALGKEQESNAGMCSIQSANNAGRNRKENKLSGGLPSCQQWLTHGQFHGQRQRQMKSHPHDLEYSFSLDDTCLWPEHSLQRRTIAFIFIFMRKLIKNFYWDFCLLRQKKKKEIKKES